jgi:hypothetical protein
MRILGSNGAFAHHRLLRGCTGFQVMTAPPFSQAKGGIPYPPCGIQLCNSSYFGGLDGTEAQQDLLGNFSSSGYIRIAIWFF